MKKIQILGIILLIGMTYFGFANEQSYSQMFLPDFSLDSLMMKWNIDSISDMSGTLNTRGYGSYSGGAKFGFGVLNVFFGLGSYIAGEWGDGLFLTFGELAGIGLTIFGVYLINKHENFKFYGSEAIILILFPIFHPMAWSIAVAATGVLTYLTFILEGHLWPFGRYFIYRPPSIPRQPKQRARQSIKPRMDMGMTFLPGLVTFNVSY